MRTVTLSDHTANQVNAAAAKRQADYDRTLEKYHAVLARQSQVKTELRMALSEAWKERRIFSAIGCWWNLWRSGFESRPSAPRMASAGREEIVWSSGSEGERKVSEFFSRRLSDDWTLISGYKNPKGEIDQVLVGPSGVFAIEIKFVNGVVHCDGDQWSRDKYDRYGNLVETGIRMQDKGGRGPSRQLNESVDRLQFFLGSRADIKRIYRVVVLSHDASRIGNLKNVRVDAVVTGGDTELASIFSCSSIQLQTEEAAKIVRTIQKDHSFHEKSRSSQRHREARPARAAAA